MSEDYQSYSRLNRFEKKRKNTKWLSIFIVVGAIFALLLIGIFIFSLVDKDDQTSGSSDELSGEDQMIDNDKNESEQNNGSENEDVIGFYNSNPVPSLRLFYQQSVDR